MNQYQKTKTIAATLQTNHIFITDDYLLTFIKDALLNNTTTMQLSTLQTPFKLRH